jgi:hypothetical protein
MNIPNIDDFPSTIHDMHLLREADARFSLCGLRTGGTVDPLRVTDDPAAVTCRECKRRQAEGVWQQ